eukprot:1510190-Amphidinium_carterae.1
MSTKVPVENMTRVTPVHAYSAAFLVNISCKCCWGRDAVGSRWMSKPVRSTMCMSARCTGRRHAGGAETSGSVRRMASASSGQGATRFACLLHAAETRSALKPEEISQDDDADAVARIRSGVSAKHPQRKVPQLARRVKTSAYLRDRGLPGRKVERGAAQLLQR